MEFQIPEITQLLEEVHSLTTEIQNLKSKSKYDDLPEWLNDEQCHALKGGCSLNTYRSRRWYQVLGGRPEAIVGGRKVWNKKTVIDWLSVTDDQLGEYHLKNKTGAKKT